MEERDRGRKPNYGSDEGARAAFDPSYRGLHQYDQRDLGRFRDEREQHGMARKLGESGYDPQQRSTQSQRYSYREWERDHERRENDRGLQGGYGENDRGFGFDPKAVERSDSRHESWGQNFVDGVKRVFRGPKGYKRSDDRIREDVYERLTRQQLLDAHEVEVSVSKGEVTLSGSVRSREEKFHAERLADAVSGVEDVHNQLRITREQESERGVLGTAVQKSANTLSVGKR